MYEIEIEDFSGPIEKLLELIEIKKLDVTKISLAKITADFLNFIRKLEENIKEEEKNKYDDKIEQKLSLLADFLVIASKLILLKSKALIPSLVLTDEEEEEIRDLENRIMIYNSLRPMFSMFGKFWKESPQAFYRNASTFDIAVFSPGENLDRSAIQKGFSDALKNVLPFVVETREIKKRKISVNQMIDKILKLITERASKFSDMLERGTREEVVAGFLALLHLIRDNLLTAKQSGLFDEIEIKKENL